MVASSWALLSFVLQRSCGRSPPLRTRRLAPTGGGVGGAADAAEDVSPFSPCFRGLAAPKRVAASRHLDLSREVEPVVITGLVDGSWRVPEDLLGSEGGVRVDVWPLDGGPCPRKLDNGTMVSPALVPVAADRVLPLLRRDPRARGYHAYVRHLDLARRPALRAALPLSRLLAVAGARVRSANLWLGDGAVRSATHWDAHDNLLLQLAGRKTFLLLPPEAADRLGLRAFRYDSYVLGDAAKAAVGRGDDAVNIFDRHARTGGAVENHGTFDAFDALGRGALPAAFARARLATVGSGEALFVPALWSHAVASEPEARGGAAGLNLAVNLWFVQACASHEAAVALRPGWAAAHYSHAAALRAAGRPAAAVAAYRRALDVAPAMFDAAHNLASALLEAGDDEGAAAQYERAHALRPRPEETRCLVNLGVLRKRQGRLDDAAAAARAALDLDDGDAKAWSLLGNVRALQDRAADADGCLARATALAASPRERANAANSHGVVLELLGRRRAALDAYDAALAAAPGHAKAAANRATLLSEASS